VQTTNIHHKETAFDLGEQIFTKSEELFMTIGIRNTTMDDLARELGISKKTLYKTIDNKGDLVIKCVQHDVMVKQRQISQIIRDYNNPMEQILYVGAHLFRSLSRYKIAIIHDLMKFYPESWQFINEHKETFVKEVVRNNLRKGIESGVYRNDIHIEIYSNFFIFGSDIFLNTQIFPETEYNFSDIFKEFLIYHLRAITSEKAQQDLDHLIKTVKF
jgi:AcrR family transcriptional regulator